MKKFIIDFSFIMSLILISMWVLSGLFAIFVFIIPDYIYYNHFNLKDCIEWSLWFLIILYLMSISSYKIKKLKKINATIKSFIVAFIPLLIAFVMYICFCL